MGANGSNRIPDRLPFIIDFFVKIDSDAWITASSEHGVAVV
jgi:hypothetical protein